MSRLPDEVPYLYYLRHGPDLGERVTNAGYGLICESNAAEDFYPTSCTQLTSNSSIRQ